MTIRARSGSALYVGVIALAGLSVFWAGMSFRAGRRSHVQLTDPAPGAVANALTGSGFGPRELAAAGVAPGAVSAIVAAVRSALVEQSLDFAQLGLNVASARQAVDGLEARVRAGDGSEGTLTSLAAARSSWSTAQSQLSGARATISAAVAGVVSETTMGKLVTIHAAGEDLPLKYRVVSRSEVNRIALRNALANQRIATACGETPDQGCSQSVATASSDATVSDADVALATNGAQATTAWKQAIGLP